MDHLLHADLSAGPQGRQPGPYRGRRPVTGTPAARPPQRPGAQAQAQAPGPVGPYTKDDFALDLRDAEVPVTAGAFAFFFGDDPADRTFT